MPVFFDAFTKIGPITGMHPRQRYTLDHLIEDMNHCSISGALVKSTLTQSFDPVLENQKLVDQLAAHDNLFPVWQACTHWPGVFPDPDTFARQLSDADVRAVTIAANTHAIDLRSKYTRPLLESLQQDERLLLLEASEVPDLIAVEHILTEFPKLPVLLTSISWSQQYAVVPLLLHHKNLHITFDRFQTNLTIEWLVEKGCVDQLVFGSAGPHMSIGAHRAYVDWAQISDDEKAKVAGGNLTRLLKGLAPPRAVQNKNEDELMAACRLGKPLPCTVYDMHAHILPEGGQQAGGVVMRAGGPKGVYELNRRIGVDRMGLMSWEGPVCLNADSGNITVTEALNAYPDFYWGLGTFDVLHDSAEVLRDKINKLYADPRYLGIKPYPHYGVKYDDLRYDVWWECANERHLYALIHPTEWWSTREVEAVIERYPNVMWVMAHTGGHWSYADAAADAAKRYENIVFELTLTPVTGGIVEDLVERCSEDRVVYGSDLPMRDPRQQLGWVVFANLPVETKHKLLATNAQRILNRVTARQAACADQ